MSEVIVEDDAAHGPGPSAARLGLVDQASLTVGVGWWHTAAATELGLDAVLITDGPNGARGARWARFRPVCPRRPRSQRRGIVILYN